MKLLGTGIVGIHNYKNTTIINLVFIYLFVLFACFIRNGSVICDYNATFRADLRVNETLKIMNTSLMNNLINTSVSHDLYLNEEYLIKAIEQQITKGW